ncbi:hypothetical protein [Steroidobacter cummioxidans]|uniref:hypothetical protein n=1 Tax=Steroidobacter cummioxidans TaxID=1803913 RepID=UPI000E31E318|nr:hypothetical protein [Steroidobacter cummioxidans]
MQSRLQLSLVVLCLGALTLTDASAADDSAACAKPGIQAGGCVVPKTSERAVAPDPVELLTKVRATYAALQSYSDQGMIVLEEQPIGATLIRERYSFETRYSAPRRFYFDFRKGAGADAERFVIWCGGETFSSWWSATQVKEEYPQGQGAQAFAMGMLPTSGTALLIPPLLFQNAGLQGALMTMTEPKYGGTQKLGGRLVHLLTGSVRLNHWSDSVRVTTLWVDAETLMIRKVFEDSPTGQGAAIQRATTTFEPVPKARLDAAAFHFAPPR